MTTQLSWLLLIGYLAMHMDFGVSCIYHVTKINIVKMSKLPLLLKAVLAVACLGLTDITLVGMYAVVTCMGLILSSLIFPC